MRHSTESQFTKVVGTMLQASGCRVFNIVAGRMQTPGLPDRYVIGKRLPGVWMEFKYGGGKLRQDQVIVLRQFYSRHVPAIVVRGFRGAPTSLKVQRIIPQSTELLEVGFIDFDGMKAVAFRDALSSLVHKACDF
jgi:hypothetical protein